MSVILDGIKLADVYASSLKEKIDIIYKNHHLTPGLAIVRVGDDAASEIYVKRKISKASELGIRAVEYFFNDDISEAALIKKIEHLNNDPKIHGIIVQLPLPDHINTYEIIKIIDPNKDIDGFHPLNVGMNLIGIEKGFIPCTALACHKLLKFCCHDLSGKNALVVGRSNIVGKPVATMLLKENATVTIAHSESLDLAELVSNADILVSAVGEPELISASWLKEKSIVIDVGINRIRHNDGSITLKGDVEFERALKKVSHITPVPGGVGPMTVICLLENSFSAMMKLHHLEII